MREFIIGPRYQSLNKIFKTIIRITDIHFNVVWFFLKKPTDSLEFFIVAITVLF